MVSYYIQATIYIAAAVITVPIVKRLGLGSVLGYLIAGVIIGPFLGLVGSDETSTIQEYAEFGVVMMLFLVGLELNPQALWKMKTRLIGLGGLQVFITTLVFMAIGIYMNLDWSVAFAIAFTLSLSSTAIVLQTFQEKKLNKTDGGKSAFSVLLFQDIAVLPVLAVLPLLAISSINNASAKLEHSSAHETISLVANVPNWIYPLIIVGVFIGVVIVGHYFIRHLFAYAASANTREIFVAVALLLVIGMTALMTLIDISPALGTFLAGVILANSEFKHELENAIDPFKGLLLGLFFMTVGAGIHLADLYEYFWVIISLTLLLMSVKVIVLYFISIIFKLRPKSRWLFALSLAQAGEFGFLLLSFSSRNNVIPEEYAQILNLVITLSMFLTPLLFIIFDKVIIPKYQTNSKTEVYDQIDNKGKIIIAGAGRFGQMIYRLLASNDLNTVMIDHKLLVIERMKRLGVKTYYGDANQIEFLATAGLKDAKLLILATDDVSGSIELVKLVKKYYPDVKILARAYDIRSEFKLKALGVDDVVRETFFSATQLGANALNEMGFHPFQAEQAKLAFEEVYLRESNKIFDEFGKDRKNAEITSLSLTKVFFAVEKSLAAEKNKNKRDKDPKNRDDNREWNPPPKDEVDSFENTSSVDLDKT